MTAPQLAFPILALTVSLALARPTVWRIRIDHAPAAVLGALLTVLTGAVSPEVATLYARVGYRRRGPGPA